MRSATLARVVGAIAVVVGAVVLAAALRAAPVEPVGFLADLPVANIAHAGAQAVAPENTMPAFEEALARGADVLEMDLQRSADDHVMVIHDGTVDRTTDGSGRVADLRRAELQSLDAGYHFEGPDGDFPWRGRGVVIPTLEEVLLAFPDTPLIVELKTDSGKELVGAVAELLEGHGRAADVVVASFDAAYLADFRVRAPEVATNLAESEVRRLYALHLVRLHHWWRPPGRIVQVPEFDGDRRVVTPRFVAAAADLGLDVQVFTVNEPPAMARLVATGARGLISDHPDRVEAVLAGTVPDVPVPSGDASLARTLQGEIGFLEPVMRGTSLLGDEEFYLLVFPLLYWCVHQVLGLRIGIMLLLSAGLNEAAKLAFASPRPYFFDPGAGLLHEESLGIPSGHAQNGVAVWGLLAADLRRRWAWVAAAAIVVVLSVSRLYLGVHYPTDVVVGWLFGAALLAAFLALWRPVAGWLGRLHPAAQVGVAVAASLGLVAAGGLARLLRAGWEVPAGWVDVTGATPDVTLGLSGVVTPAGALAGLGVGLVVLHGAGGFDVAGTWWRRAARYPLGLAGVALLWFGLGALFPGGENPAALALRYLRYALVGVWIAGLAPLLFVRVGLAPPGRPATDRRYTGAPLPRA